MRFTRQQIRVHWDFTNEIYEHEPALSTISSCVRFLRHYALQEIRSDNNLIPSLLYTAHQDFPCPRHHIPQRYLQRSLAQASLQRERVTYAQADHAIDPLHRIEPLAIKTVRLIVRQRPLTSYPSLEDGPALPVRPRVAHERPEFALWYRTGEHLRLGCRPCLCVVDGSGGS